MKYAGFNLELYFKTAVDIGDNYPDHKHVSVHFLLFYIGRMVKTNVTDSDTYNLQGPPEKPDDIHVKIK
jgi:hypothetical protein